MTAILVIPPPPLKGYALPKSPPKYSFVAGTWGDVIAGLGNHQYLMQGLGQKVGAILYYGPDKTIADWLRIQPMVNEVIDIRSPGPVKGIPTDPVRRNEWTGDFFHAFKLRLELYDLWPCHVDFTLRERLPVYRPTLRSTKTTSLWALSKTVTMRRTTVLFQPRSETSCLWEGHWPFWSSAVRWLLDEVDGTVILCGKGDFGDMFGEHRRLVNLVNETPSMPHLFALAEQCDKVITTSNALSLFAASMGLPTVVCCNTTHRRPEQFFTRFAKGPRSEIVEHWQGMNEFKAAWAKVMG